MNFPHDYILAIHKDNAGRLSLREIALPELFPALLPELEGMLLDRESTVEDMQGLFRLYIELSDKNFDYSYYGQIGGCNTFGQFYPQIFEYTEKEDYMQMVRQYLWAMSYTKTDKDLANNPSIVLWSWLDQNYRMKEIAVSDHLKVKLSTNFGHGLNSYFDLSIYYRDVLILPYYHVVEYLTARKYGSTSFNYDIDKRGYVVWRDAFSKIIEIANMSEKKFIDKWIICPVSNMLNDMNMLLDRPDMAIGYYFGNNRVEFASLFREFSKPQIMMNFQSKEECDDWYWRTIPDKISDTVAMMSHASELMPFVPGIEKLMLKARELYHRALPLMEIKKEEYSTAGKELLDKARKEEYTYDEVMKDIKIKQEIVEQLASTISRLRDNIINNQNDDLLIGDETII